MAKPVAAKAAVGRGAGKPASGPADLARYLRLLAAKRGGEHAYAVLLGLERGDAQALLERVHRGLPFDAFERLQRNAGLGAEELAALVRIPPRTLLRRRATGRLTPDESDRLVRAARVLGRALALFDGDPAAARRWLETPAAALGGRPPLAVADTDVGAREVEALAGRLEHGVFP